MKFFLPDDAELQKIRNSYTKGELLSGEIKKIAIEQIQPIVAEHQEKRKLITDEVLDQFMAIRPLKFDWYKYTAYVTHLLKVYLLTWNLYYF